MNAVHFSGSINNIAMVTEIYALNWTGIPSGGKRFKLSGSHAYHRNGMCYLTHSMLKEKGMKFTATILTTENSSVE